MKLFEEFEAVKFPEENLIFITKSHFIYYIYTPRNNSWDKYKMAGRDNITVENYPDVSKSELMDAMGGIFPDKETDFIRLCRPSQLWTRDLMILLEEDFSDYMADYDIYHTAHEFLLESDVRCRSYEKLRELFDQAVENRLSRAEILTLIKELSFSVIGRDIFKKEIGIVDGHDCSSYFWFMPVRVYDSDNTQDWDTVAEMNSNEISIEEDDVAQYLTPFLSKYFDEELDVNKKRIDEYWDDDEGEHISYIEGFEWYLTHNFYTYESFEKILTDIRETIDALSNGKETEYTRELKIKRGRATDRLVAAKNLTDEQIKEYNDNRPTEDDTEVELIIDFYQRFLYRMEYMIRVGREKGYNLISVMGP